MAKQQVKISDIIRNLSQNESTPVMSDDELKNLDSATKNAVNTIIGKVKAKLELAAQSAEASQKLPSANQITRNYLRDHVSEAMKKASNDGITLKSALPKELFITNFLAFPWQLNQELNGYVSTAMTKAGETAPKSKQDTQTNTMPANSPVPETPVPTKTETDPEPTVNAPESITQPEQADSMLADKPATEETHQEVTPTVATSDETHQSDSTETAEAERSSQESTAQTPEPMASSKQDQGVATQTPENAQVMPEEKPVQTAPAAPRKKTVMGARRPRTASAKQPTVPPAQPVNANQQETPAPAEGISSETAANVTSVPETMASSDHVPAQNQAATEPLNHPEEASPSDEATKAGAQTQPSMASRPAVHVSSQKRSTAHSTETARQTHTPSQAAPELDTAEPDAEAAFEQPQPVAYQKPANMGVDNTTDSSWDMTVVQDFGFPFINMDSRDMKNLLRGDKLAQKRAYRNVKDQLRVLAKLRTGGGIFGGLWDAFTMKPIKMLKALLSSKQAQCYQNIVVANGFLVRGDAGSQIPVNPVKHGDIRNRLDKSLDVPLAFLNKFYVELNPERHTKAYSRFGLSTELDGDGVPMRSILAPNRSKPTVFYRTDTEQHSNVMIKCAVDGHRGGFIIPKKVADKLFTY